MLKGRKRRDAAESDMLRDLSEGGSAPETRQVSEKIGDCHRCHGKSP